MERSESNSSLSSRSLSEFVDDSYPDDSMPEVNVSMATTPRGIKSASSGSRVKSAVSMRSISTPSRPASGISMTKNIAKTPKKPVGKLKRNDKRSGSLDHSMEDEDEKKEPELIDPEEKLSACLETCLADCSRQRLRAFHMSLRHLGNVDNRVSAKDTQGALQENQIKLPDRCWAMILDLFEDGNGIDYEKLCVCLSAAHLKTGRDSIKARNKRNDTEARDVFRQEDVDEDFIRRLEELLIHDHTFYDIECLRGEFAKWDLNRIGKVDKEGATLICEDKTPLYGALLKNLLNRCDEAKEKKISWPLLLNFMERSQTRAREKCPELSALPEKAKEVASRSLMTPDPIDELSSSARNAVSRLLKKAHKRRGNSADSSPDPPFGRDSRLSQSRPVSVTSERDPANQNATPKADASLKIDEVKANGTNAKDNSKNRLEGTNSDVDPNLQNGKKNGGGVVDLTALKTSGKEEGGGKGRNINNNNNNKRTTARRGGVEDEEHLVQIPGSEADVVVPRGFKPICSNQEPPQERLSLEWIYGYHGNDCNNKLQLVGDGEIIYFVGAVVVMCCLETEAQRHYREHTGNVRCLCVHSNGLIVASGQQANRNQLYDEEGTKACLHVWRCDTLQTLHILGEGVFHKSVLAIAFMPGEHILASVDSSTEKKLIVWDTERGTAVAETFVNTSTLCDLQFNPKFPETLVTAGREHLEWWKVNKEAGLIQPSALPKYELFLKARFIHTVAHTQKGDLVTGDSNGTVYVWGGGGNSITNYIKHGHGGPVYSLLYHKGTLFTGGREGVLKTWEWGKNMNPLSQLELPPMDGGIRSIFIHPTLVGEGNSPALILGTTMNGLFLGHTDTTDGGDLVSVTQGHTDDVRGLATIGQSTTGADVITVSRDGILCQFNTRTRSVVWKMVVKGYSFTCVDASTCGQQLVMGTKDGHLVVIHVSQEDGTVLEVMNRKLTSSALTCVKVTPDFKTIAAGGMDKTIYVFCLRKVEKEKNNNNNNNNNNNKNTTKNRGKAEEEEEVEEEKWVGQGKCKGHLAPMTSLDWSRDKHKDTYVLRSCSSHPEQLFWNPLTCTQLPGHEICDVTWYSHTCTLDHSVIGLWSAKQVRGNQVSCLDVHPSMHLVAMTTEDNGVLSLFRYPSYSEGAFSHVFKAHHLTRQIRFTPGGRGLVTVGGTDLSIMQWKLT